MPQHRRFIEGVLPHLDAGYNFARWLARDPHDAEDVVQDACMRAMKYIDSLHAVDGRAWFLTIVRRSFYDWLADNRPADVVVDDGSAVEAAAADPAWEPEHRLLQRAESRALAEAVAALPTQYREVLVLHELEALPYKAIARIVDVPIGTVMSRLSRARALLRGSPALQAVVDHPTRAAS